MFQKIATIYYNIKNKETNNSAILFESMAKFYKHTKNIQEYITYRGILKSPHLA